MREAEKIIDIEHGLAKLALATGHAFLDSASQ